MNPTDMDADERRRARLNDPAGANPGPHPLGALETRLRRLLRLLWGGRSVDMFTATQVIADALTTIENLTRQPAPGFDLVNHLQRQIDFSARTFGPGDRLQGVVDHIRKELVEVETSGGDLREWVDVIILAFDGAWRSGATSQQIVDAIVAKQTKNEGRRWPDWRTAPAGQAIEHDRTQDAPWEREGDAA